MITAAELIHGMWVAGKREDGTWTAGTVNGNSSIISRGGLWLGALEDFGHFILLEDAPTSDDDGDDFPCCGGGRAKLQAEVDRLSDALRLASREKDEWEANYTELADSTPRVISTDELQEGQLVCIHRGHGWGVRAIGEFRELFDNKITLKTGGSGTFSESIKFHTIVLLEDAPEPFVMADWERELLQEKADDDPAPRLTVEDLDAAGVGSQLEIKSTVFIKTAKGGWSTYNDGVMGYPSEYMIRNGWDAATLTHPERGDHEQP